MQYRRTVTKTLIGAAVIAGCWVGLAAPASAEPNPSGNSDPFGPLHCGARHETARRSGLEPAMNEGIQQGLSLNSLPPLALF